MVRMVKSTQKISAGGRINCKKKEGVIGAIVKYKEKNCILTVYHILKAGKCHLGDMVRFNGFNGSIIQIFMDYDLALIEVHAPLSRLEFSKIGDPEIGPAHALKGTKRNPCNILTVGKTFHYLSFAPRSIPLPGDSGSPIIQEDRVVGILASIFYNNATGIAVSIGKFRSD
jgi:hypothetical protein